jgi:hypothetical protein
LKSRTSSEVRAANGISRTRSLACSVAPSTASSAPMIRMVVEAKNEAVDDNCCTTTPSSTRTSR